MALSRSQQIKIAMRKNSLDQVGKASFGGNRSDAGRYAANIRWQNQIGGDTSGDVFTPISPQTRENIKWSNAGAYGVASEQDEGDVAAYYTTTKNGNHYVLVKHQSLSDLTSSGRGGGGNLKLRISWDLYQSEVPFDQITENFQQEPLEFDTKWEATNYLIRQGTTQ